MPKVQLGISEDNERLYIGLIVAFLGFALIFGIAVMGITQWGILQDKAGSNVAAILSSAVGTVGAVVGAFTGLHAGEGARKATREHAMSAEKRADSAEQRANSAEAKLRKVIALHADPTVRDKLQEIELAGSNIDLL